VIRLARRLVNYRPCDRGLLVVAGAFSLGCGDPVVVDDDPIVWTRPAETATTRPAIDDSFIYFGGNNGAVWAIERDTGELAWRRTLIDGYAVLGDALGMTADAVLVPIYEVWAVDRATGSVLWTYGGPDGAAGTRDVATSGEVVFTASQGGWAAAVDARTGDELWSTDLGERPWEPSLSEELVIYGTRGWSDPVARNGALGAGHVIALRRDDGSEAWRYPLPDSAGFPLSGGAVHGGVIWQDRVVVGSLSTWAYALRLSDGELLWSRPNGESPSIAGYTSPAASIGGLGVFGRANFSIDAWNLDTGELAWTLDRPSPVHGSVSVGEYLYTIQGKITVGDETGAILWEFGGLSSSGVGGAAYFSGNVAEDGTIYALRTGVLRGGGTEIQAIRPPIRP
jgi:outer membrane protein assembly factor BamB